MKTEGYARPDTLEEVLAVLAEVGAGGRVLAGGTDLMLGVRAGKEFTTLINISRVEELRGIHVRDGALEVGATVTVARLLRSAEVREQAPLLWQAANHFASPLVRSRATLGGNLGNASPAADLALALLASDAEVLLASRAGRRALSVEQLILGPGRTALTPGELIIGVRIPARGRERFHRFEKSGPRPALEISLAAVAVSLEVVEGRVVEPRIAYGAVAPVPLRGRRVEELLAGRPLTPEVIDEAAAAAAAEVRPIDDVRGTAIYRRRLVAAFLRRCLAAALESRRSLDATGS